VTRLVPLLLLCLSTVVPAQAVSVEELVIRPDGEIVLELNLNEDGAGYFFRAELEWWTWAGERGYRELEYGRRHTRFSGPTGPLTMGELSRLTGGASIKLAVITVTLVDDAGNRVREEYRWRP